MRPARRRSRTRIRKNYSCSMSTTEISDAMARAIAYLRDHPDEAKYTDSAATAVLEESLRVSVIGPDGANLPTDMLRSIGGRGEPPSPGRFLRAALASCLACVPGLEAARAGVSLKRVE